MQEIPELVRELQLVPVDDVFLSRDKLDIDKRDRTSLYPWRGQFSPGLVATLLEAYAPEGCSVLDPFVGSGTTLFESARRDLSCTGIEIHPAALAFSGMARLCNLEELDRKEVCVRGEKLIEKWLGDFLPANLFRSNGGAHAGALDQGALRALKDEASADMNLHDFVLSTILLAAGDERRFTGSALDSALRRNTETVMSLPFTREPCQVIAADARQLRLESSVVDLVVTSPPYINVFNYHHNYRAVLELMDWRLLDVAPSEIGANRKHRGNRFLTVIQFCMDLVQVFLELRRVLGSEGRAVIVIGRESKVRGVPFNNGMLLALAATSGAGFQLQRWQERRFTNRFGTSIFEEILTLSPHGEVAEDPVEFGRAAGTWALQSIVTLVHGEIHENVTEAIRRAKDVRPSPLLA